MASLLKKENAKVARLPEPPHAMEEGSTEDLWPPLRRAIQDILEKGDSGQPFTLLYRRAQAMVVHKQGALLHSGLRDALTDHLANKVRPAVLASAHDAFLRTLNQAWNDYQTRIKHISAIVLYLEQIYVPHHNVSSVQDLSLLLFRDEVAHHGEIRGKLQESLLQTLRRDREGEMVDRLSIRNACQMLGKLGVNSRSVYEEDFERPFLAESAEFYALESQKHLAEKSAIGYVDMVVQRMSEESERAKFCLDPSTERPIQEVVFQELVANHVDAIVEDKDSGIEAMLKNQNVVGLTRMFRLLSRAKNGRKAVAGCVSKYLRELGRSLMGDDGDKRDPLCLVKDLMDLKDHYERLLKSCFNAESFVKLIINADFEYVINLTSKSAERLALFADDALRNSITGMTKEDTEHLFDQIALFVRFLQERDLFEHFYQQYLCKRLLRGISASQDAEISMLSKLEVMCDPDFASRLQAMLRDMSVSRTIREEFKTAVASCKLELHGLDLNVRVLTMGSWPFPAATQQCIIPAGPLSAFETFRRFYLAKRDGRRLDLQPQLGYVEMRAVFYPPGDPSTSSAASVQLSGPRAYIILTSTYQMCVLMLFNRRDKIKYKDIVHETSIPEADLVRALQFLTVGEATQQVLVKEPPTNDFEPGHVLAVNEYFTSDRNKVKIEATIASKEGGSSGNENVARNFDKDRRFVTEAAIVRIMKSEQRLSHSELVTKLADMLGARFTPSPEAIERRIEALIDREYLERAPENAEVYVYVP